MSMDTPQGYRVDARACIGCGACATVAPACFAMSKRRALVTAPPSSEEERRGCEAASALCPTQAIEPAETPVRAPEISGGAPPSSARYAQLARVAEEARWRQADLPWGRFDASGVSKGLREIVREMAFSEQTTYSATQRFMQTFADDAEFTQWLSVWFYEETRHPSVLLRWLALAGEEVQGDFVTRGRVSAPFMRSRLGTLATNVISEIVAAGAYFGLAKASPEPLLGQMAQEIASDEARHAASFFVFARAMFVRDGATLRDRLDALKVLHFWLNETDNVTHPVNQSMEKFRAMGEALGVPVSFAPPRERICKAVALLADLPLTSSAEVPALLHALTAELHAAAASRGDGR